MDSISAPDDSSSNDMEMNTALYCRKGLIMGSISMALSSFPVLTSADSNSTQIPEIQPLYVFEMTRSPTTSPRRRNAHMIAFRLGS